MKKMYSLLLPCSLLLLAPITLAQSATKADAKTKSAPHAASQKVDDMLDSFQMMEKGLWEAWKKRDAKPFDQHLTADAVLIDATGIADKAAALKGVVDCDVKSYTLGDFKLTKVDADAALLTYKATGVNATCAGQKTPETVLASTLFKKSGGTWRMLFHQETAAMPLPSSAKK
jgi:hypothetical protein